MHMTHQPRTLFDPQVGTLELYWDANGNLAQMIGCKQNTGRLHEWDEENRLRFVLGERFASYYGYDANGERVYKLTGISILDQVNSGSTKAQAIFDDAVLYPNPYVVVTSKGYTKHYYAGTERIATVIGTGGFDDMVTTIDKLSSPHDQNIVKTFYSDLENKYGKGSVVLSDVLTAKEFQQDWVAMSSQDIQEVNINHHGSNQAIHLDWQTKQYITSTGTGETRGGVPAINVSDLGFPSGNVSNATLNLNTCHSNSTGSWLGNIRIGIFRILGTSATLVGTKETLMQSFRNTFNFHTIRGTSAGVSYNRKTLRPEPQFFFQSWVYLYSK